MLITDHKLQQAMHSYNNLDDAADALQQPSALNPCC
jgi:hypothetical protein